MSSDGLGEGLVWFLLRLAERRGTTLADATLFLLAGLVLLRLGLLFPAIAVDSPYGAPQAWRDSGRHGFRLLAAALLLAALALFIYVVVRHFLVPVLLVNAGLAFVLAALPPAGFLFPLIEAACLYPALALVVGMSSLAFWACSGWEPPPSRLVEVF